MLIIVTSVLIEGPHVPAELKGDPSKRLTIIQPGVFQAIGVISFAYVCHHNSLLIYGSMQTPTLDRFAKVTHISTFISLVACCTLAISGFVTFTNKTMGNILNNFSPVIAFRLVSLDPTAKFSSEQCIDQCCTILLWAQHVHNPSSGAICVQRSESHEFSR
jgi:Transmembrane amino acid transporter protein